MVAAFYLPRPTDSWFVCGLFILASVTDYLDGYLARAWGQQSRFGQFLDPIADKILVAAALLMLVAHQLVTEWTVLPALVILAREFLVSGLREFLAQVKVGLPVSRLAKWKTAVQMVAIAVMLGGGAGESLLPWLPLTRIGEAVLWIAAAITLVTGYDYWRASLGHLRENAVEKQV
jgi:cardiolipin synthase